MELARAAANIENLCALPDRFRRDHEFGAAVCFWIDIEVVEPAVEIEIKFMIAFDHRIKEIEAYWGFPQTKTLCCAKTRPRIDAKFNPPEIFQKARCHPLDKPHGWLLGDRAKGNIHKTFKLSD